jgi:formate/nitrite transporter FocA (FNT family)
MPGRPVFGRGGGRVAAGRPPAQDIPTRGDDIPQDDRGPNIPEAESRAARSYRRILSEELGLAIREFDRPTSGLLISSFSAGLDVGFGPLLMAVFLTAAESTLTEPITRLITAGFYALGFLIVILGRSELFTEHTTRAVLPVLSGEAGFRSLARVWALVLAGNLVGAAGFAAFASVVATRLGVVDPAVFGEIATTLTGHRWWVVLLSAILAGWLMGLLSWLVVAARDTIGEIVVILVVTGAIGMAQLHHSIAGTVEVLFGVFAGSVGVGAFATFLVWAVVGNAVGGTVFVAILKYGHVVRSVPEPNE